MLKTLIKSPFLLVVFMTSLFLAGCGDTSQSSAEQATDQAQETVDNATEETTTQE